MRINSVQTYTSVSKKSNVKTQNSNNVNFGWYTTQYKKAFNEFYNTEFVRYAGKLNYELYSNMFKKLGEFLASFPTYTQKNGFHEAHHFTKWGAVPYLESLAEDLNVKPGMSKYLVEDNGKKYLGIHNMGRYDKGWFSKTDHSQIVLEFRDPDTDRFIGFSPDIDKNSAITRGAERIEFYDYSIEYPIKRISHQGYIPEVYDVMLDGDGNIMIGSL